FYFTTGVPSPNGTSCVTCFDSQSAAAGGTWGHSLAYCNANGSSNCAIEGHIYGLGSWANDPGNILGYADRTPTSNNPNFANLAGNDFHLQSGSPAIGAGTYLTTVAAGD